MERPPFPPVLLTPIPSDKGNLVLSRKPGQAVWIGNALVTVHEIRGNRVRLNIQAPRNVRIVRSELETH